MVNKLKVRRFSYFCIAVSYYLITTISPVYAAIKLPKGRSNEFIEGDIVFYNPDGKKAGNCLSPDRNCQTSDGSDISVVGDGFLDVSDFKKELRAQFPKIDTNNTNYETVSSLKFDDLITNLNTKNYKKNLIISYGTEVRYALTKDQINQIILAAGSTKNIAFFNNYGPGNIMEQSNKYIEEAVKTYNNVKIVDFSTKVNKDLSYIDNYKISSTATKDIVSILKSIFNSGCSGNFTKYNFTDQEIRAISAMAQAENGESPPTSVVTEVSQMANLAESKRGARTDNEKQFLETLNSSWYASSTRAQLNNPTMKVSDDTFNAVKEALNSGKRNLPTGVMEHDSLSDITSITNDGVAADKNDRSKYISKKTVIKNRMGSTYIFYQWADPNAAGSRKGDPFGYFQSKGVGEFESSISASTTSMSSSSTPIKSTGPASDPNVVVTSDRKNYAGDLIINPENYNKIQTYRPIYEKAAKEVGIPWQILAALHNREHSLLKSNPSNGQGVYQLYSYTNGGTNSESFLPSGDITDDEFLRQSKLAAKIIKEKTPELTESPNADVVKRAFYRFNGAAYKQQGLDMGFTPEQADNGEGSPYVMSRADSKRDSVKENVTWTMYLKDNQVSSGVKDYNFGTYVVYLAVGGSTDNSGTIDCLNSSSRSASGGNSAISKTAIDLTWHQYDTDSQTKEHFAAAKRSALRKTGTIKYKEAQKTAKTVGDESDCGRFVSTVLRISGVDPNFPAVGTADDILPYLQSHTDLYENIQNNGDTSVLQSGDILIVKGHVKLAINIDGKFYEAHASLGGRAPEILEGINVLDSRGPNGRMYIFRKK